MIWLQMGIDRSPFFGILFSHKGKPVMNMLFYLDWLMVTLIITLIIT
jgi:hypothetical protein